MRRHNFKQNDIQQRNTHVPAMTHAADYYTKAAVEQNDATKQTRHADSIQLSFDRTTVEAAKTKLNWKWRKKQPIDTTKPN